MTRHTTTLLISLIYLSLCSTLALSGQPYFTPVGTDGARIVLNTALERGETISFTIHPIEHGVWVDQNGDGKFQAMEMASNPEDDVAEMSAFIVTFTVVYPEITIYGKVDQLMAPDCQLTDIDLSHATELHTLEAYRNELSTISIPASAPIQDLWLANNQLTQFDLSQAPQLWFLELYNNKISEQAMTDSFHTLQRAAPVADPELGIPVPTIQVIDTKSDLEENICNVDAVAHAKGLGWAVYDLAGDTKNWEGVPYEGSPTALSSVQKLLPSYTRTPEGITLQGLTPQSQLTLYDLTGHRLLQQQVSSDQLFIPLESTLDTDYLLQVKLPDGQSLCVKL